jgi:biotin carboxylase
MKRVLLLLPVASYRNEDFLEAAQRLGVEVIPVADYCPQLAPGWGLDPMLAVPFDQPAVALATVLRHLPQKPDAVLAVDDHGLELAALLREHLGLSGNPNVAVTLTRDKLAFRQLLRGRGLNAPSFRNLPHDADLEQWAEQVDYPAVVKARRLSSSRGVVRVNDKQEFIAAAKWVRQIQGRADRESQELGLVVEDFIPGKEYALEGLLNEGKLTVLALFDKPDPLDGPYFEETIYVTPSRLPEAMQGEIADTVRRACELAGLVSGPIHAEMRVNQQGVWLLEVAARSIGGLCGRVLRHALGMSLEEVVLRQALGMPVPQAEARGAAGVLMIPVPKRGIYQGVSGMDVARRIPGVTDIQIAVEPGTRMLPVPEGASYLGFIFSQAATPAQAEQALRVGHNLLGFDIQTEVEVVTQRGERAPS